MNEVRKNFNVKGSNPRVIADPSLNTPFQIQSSQGLGPWFRIAFWKLIVEESVLWRPVWKSAAKGLRKVGLSKVRDRRGEGWREVWACKSVMSIIIVIISSSSSILCIIIFSNNSSSSSSSNSIGISISISISISIIPPTTWVRWLP